MSTDSYQKLQDELVALLAPDLASSAVTVVQQWLAAASGMVSVRGVGTANHSLAAFVGVTGGSTTNTDGVTFKQGDLVLLAAQTTAANNGPYVVGAVASGTAPLTRPSWFATGMTVPNGLAFRVGGEGTLFKNTTWRSFVSAQNYVVDTTDGKFYPERVTWSAALVAGIMTAGASATSGAPAVMPVFSTSSQVIATRTTANTATSTTGGYAQIVAPTAGVCGVGAVDVRAAVAAGTINVADVSTLLFTLINQL